MPDGLLIEFVVDCPNCGEPASNGNTLFADYEPGEPLRISDQQVRDLDDLDIAIRKMREAAAEREQVWARRDLAAWQELQARAAAAEAAVQRVREAAKVGHDRCVYQPHAIENEYERGKAHALDDVYRLLANAADTQSQPDLTTVSGIVNAAPDDQPVTVTGHIHHVEARENRAGAPYVELVLVDRAAELEDSDPDAVTVVIPASVYAAMDLAMRPRVGTLVEVTGRAVREVLVIASGVREAARTDGGAL
jgi:hypothetical protein